MVDGISLSPFTGKEDEKLMRSYEILDDDGIRSTATEEELYTAFSKIVWSLLKGYNDSTISSYREDLASVAIYECLKAMLRYKPTGSVYAYAKTVARHKLSKEAERIRKYNSMVQPLSTEEVDSLLLEDCEPPDDELIAWIEKLKKLLDQEELAVVNLTLQGLNNSDICEVLQGKRKQGTYVTTIWKRIRAKALTLGHPLDPRKEDDKP